MSRIILFTLLILVLSLFIPVNIAAPQVLPTSSSLVDVGLADYFQFARGDTTGTGASWTLTAPNGDSATFQFGGDSCTGNRIRFYLLNATIFPDEDSGCSMGAGIASWVKLSGDTISNTTTADGTWQIRLNNAPIYISYDTAPPIHSPGPTLSVQGKAIHNGASYACLATVSQFWNWHQTTGTWNEPSTTGGANCVTTPDPIDEGLEEDPNNAIFFQDSGTSEYTAYTLHYGESPSNCETFATTTVNGAWIGASGTTFSQFIYRDGNFLGIEDLRTVGGASTTTEENEGSTGSGTDTKSISYNTVAGTSYQFKVRTVAQGEALGEVQFIPDGLCSVSSFNTNSDVEHNMDAIHVTVSQAQCKDDPVSFSVSMQDNPSGLQEHLLELFIFDSQQGGFGSPPDPVEVFKFNTTTMHRTGPSSEAHTHFVAKVFAPGAYIAFGYVNYTGIGAVDYIDSEAFNVPFGTCIWQEPDLTGVFIAIESVQNDVDYINGTTININDTVNNLSEMLTHINIHLHYINNTTSNIEENLTTFVVNTTTWFTHLNQHLHFLNTTALSINQTVNNIYNDTQFLSNITTNIHSELHGLINLTNFINDTIISNHLNETAFLNHLNNHLHDIDFNLTDYYNNLVIILQDLEDQATAHHMNMTEYFDHVNNHLHNINATFILNNSTIVVNNTPVLEAIDDLTSFSIEQFPLLLIAIAFFVIMADTRNNFFYWFIAFILSIYLLIIRPVDSSIPIPVFIGWLFVLIYNMFSFIANAKAQNLDGTPE